MTPFRTLLGVAAPLLRANIDTDAIIPSREMKRVSKRGLGQGLFSGWRYLHENGRRVRPNPDFVLNRPEYSGTSILLVGPNFGCGSSREHAVWALVDFGIRAVIAPSFGSIFYNNSFKNGLLPIVLPERAIAELVESLKPDPQVRRLDVDLVECVLTDARGRRYPVQVEPDRRERLLQGINEIDLALQHDQELQTFKKEYLAGRPWAQLD